ncbi:hypothetical protein SKAU_G00153520, partial [Synaphobranchus kaupii]
EIQQKTVLLLLWVIEPSYLCHLVDALRRDLIGCCWSGGDPEESRGKQIPQNEIQISERKSEDEINVLIGFPFCPVQNELLHRDGFPNASDALLRR